MLFATGVVIVDVMPKPKDHFAPGGSKTGSVKRRTPSTSRIVVAVPRCVIETPIALPVLLGDRPFDPFDRRCVAERHGEHVDPHALDVIHLLQPAAPDPARCAKE